MNKIFIKEIEKAWISKDGLIGSNKKGLYIFAQLSDNFLLTPLGKYQKQIKKIKIRFICETAIFTDYFFRIEITKKQYKYFMDIINAEEDACVKLINKEEEKNLNNKLSIEQKFASYMIDCDFEKFEENKDKKEKYYKVKFDIEDEDIELAELEEKIKDQVTKGNFIHSKNIFINILKKEAKVIKTDYRLVAEYVSEKEKKKLIYKEYQRVYTTSNFEQTQDMILNKIICDANKYDNTYALIDFEEINNHFLMKGMYIKSEKFRNKLIYIEGSKLLDYFKENPFDSEDLDKIIENIKMYLNKNKIVKF